MDLLIISPELCRVVEAFINKNIVGNANILTFGLTVDEVLNYYTIGGYHSYEYYNNDQNIKRVVDQLTNGFFTNSPTDEFVDLNKSLLDYNDEYFVLKDFNSYVEAQNKIEKLYMDFSTWHKMSVINIAHSGIFSSDRTIKEYATGIWGSGYLYKNL